MPVIITDTAFVPGGNTSSKSVAPPLAWPLAYSPVSCSTKVKRSSLLNCESDGGAARCGAWAGTGTCFQPGVRASNSKHGAAASNRAGSSITPPPAPSG